MKETYYVDDLPAGYSVGKFKVMDNGKTVRVVIKPYHYFPNPDKMAERPPINPKYIVNHGYKIIMYRR